MDSELDHLQSSFVRQCKELMIEPAKSILDRIAVSNLSPQNWGRYTLNLSSILLSTKTCEVLSKLLVHDATFSEINLNNCSITEGGMRALCLGLTDNVTCRKLSLLGNSIRGEGASCLGRMIRNNLKLHSLCLDTNSIGLLENDFVVFCEGLAGNRSLHILDLQNNQVTPKGAQALSESLKLNDAIRCIDLRFNHIGLLGGRALLSMLKRNKTISKLLLDGNDIPRDVISAIEACVARNAISSCAATGHCSTDCGSDLRQTFRNITVDSKFRHIPTGSAFDRLNNLSNVLDERKRQVQDVTLDLAKRNDDLLISEEKLKETNKMMKMLMTEHEGEVAKLKQESNRDVQEHKLTERRLVKEITELSEKKYALENKMTELELKSKLKDDRINEMHKNMAELEGKLKLKQAEFEETLSQEKQKFKIAVNDSEMLKNKELEILKKDRENAEAVWKEERRMFESERHRLETSLKDVKSEFERSKVKKEEDMESLRVAMRTEEAHKRSAYEQRLHEMERSRDEVQMTFNKVQGERSKLMAELESVRQTISELQQEVAVKQKEKMEEVSRVKSQSAIQIKELEHEVKLKDSNLRDFQLEIQMLRSRLRSLKELDVQHSTTLQLVAQNLVTREVVAMGTA